MRESDYYPAGAYSDPNAPYNQCEPPDIELDVTITEVMVKQSSIVTNNAWYVTDEEGYTELERDNLDVVSESDEQNGSLCNIIEQAKDEIAKIREAAEERQRELEAYYGVRHNCIPGYYLPDIPEGERSWHINRRRILGDAMKRIKELRALEDALDGWEREEIEVKL